MTTFFVTRHSGAVDWTAQQRNTASTVMHLDIAAISPGDIVRGALPVPLAAKVCDRGGRYLHLSIDLPPEGSGRELSADEMERYGARLTEYRVETPGTP